MKRIKLRHKTSPDSYDVLYPQTNARSVKFNPGNKVVTSTDQFKSIHNPLYSTNVQDALEEVDENIYLYGREFNKVDIPPCFPKDETKILQSNNGSVMGILHKISHTFYTSNDGGKNWYVLCIYGANDDAWAVDFAIEQREIKTNGTDADIWILQHSLDSQGYYKSECRLIIQYYDIPRTGTSVNINNLPVCSDMLVKNGTDLNSTKFIFGLSETRTGINATKRDATVGVATFKDTSVVKLCSYSGFSDQNEYVQTALTNGGILFITSVIREKTDNTVNKSYIYCYNVSGTDNTYLNSVLYKNETVFTDILIGGDEYVFLTENPSLVYYTTENSKDSQGKYQFSEVNLSYLLNLVDGMTKLPKLFYVNNTWCAIIYSDNNNNKLNYIAISDDSKSIRDTSKHWNVKSYSDIMLETSYLQEYKNIANNVDSSLLSVVNMEREDLIVPVSIVYAFQNKNEDYSFNIMDSMGNLVSVNNKVETRPTPYNFNYNQKVDINNISSSDQYNYLNHRNILPYYAKPIKGAREHYIVSTSSMDIDFDPNWEKTAETTRSGTKLACCTSLGYSLDGKKWISFNFSNEICYSGLEYIGDYYVFSGVGANKSSDTSVYPKWWAKVYNTKTKELKEDYSTGYNSSASGFDRFFNSFPFSQICTNYKQIHINTGVVNMGNYQYGVQNYDLFSLNNDKFIGGTTLTTLARGSGTTYTGVGLFFMVGSYGFLQVRIYNDDSYTTKNSLNLLDYNGYTAYVYGIDKTRDSYIVRFPQWYNDPSGYYASVGVELSKLKKTNDYRLTFLQTTPIDLRYTPFNNDYNKWGYTVFTVKSGRDVRYTTKNLVNISGSVASEFDYSKYSKLSTIPYSGQEQYDIVGVFNIGDYMFVMARQNTPVLKQSTRLAPLTIWSSSII